jgi:NAD(P)H dehydrogenase (quinone)
MYGHVAKLAEAEKSGIEEAGGKVDVFQYVVGDCGS